jgi:hypothetical protein
MFVEQILELGALALEARSPHVRDIVGDNLDIEFLGHHSSCRGVKRSHDFVSCVSAASDRNFRKLLNAGAL